MIISTVAFVQKKRLCALTVPAGTADFCRRDGGGTGLRSCEKHRARSDRANATAGTFPTYSKRVMQPQKSPR
jgi:hypothetical protein